MKMFNCLFRSKFYPKCKLATKLTKTRIDIIRKKRNAMQKYMRNDIADLLRNGFDVDAFKRAERLLVEMNLSTRYDLIELFCAHISSHLAVLDKHRECPKECKEAVSFLMFAVAGFADLPELHDLRALFSERFGKYLDCYVSQEFVDKVKQGQPSKDMKIQLMREIASESGLERKSEALENELYKSTESKQDWMKKNDESKNRVPQIDIAEHSSHKSRDAIHPIRDNEVETTRRNDKTNGVETFKMDSDEEEEESFSHKRRPHPRIKPEVEKSRAGNSENSAGNNKEKKKHLTERNPEKPEEEKIILKYSVDSGNGQSEEEEEMLDRLLLHYAGKKSPFETEEWDLVDIRPSCDTSMDTSKATKCSRNRNGSSRGTASLPVELTSPPETSKQHARASSLQPEILNSDRHVHPKLPDYDEFIARLAAFRGK